MTVADIEKTDLITNDKDAFFSKEYRYTQLQVAVSKYETSLSSLTEQQRFEVENIALKQCEIQRRVLSSEQATKIVIAPSHLEQEVQSIISRYANPKEFEKELEKNDLSLETFPIRVERGLRVEQVMDYVASTAEEYPESNARLYYYMNIDKFMQPELRNARHILITINPDYPENCREEVIKRSTAISKRLQKKPSRFSEQAQKHSECPTAMNGGELGMLKRGVLFPSLDKALFSMGTGEISDIIESPMGFHVLYCEQVQYEGYVNIESALPTIIEKMNERNRKNHQRQWLKELFKDQ